MKKVSSLLIVLAILLLLSGCNRYKPEISETRNIEPEIDGYIFVGNRGVTINNLYYDYRTILEQTLRRNYLNTREKIGVNPEFNDDTAYFLYENVRRTDKNDPDTSVSEVSLLSISLLDGSCTLHHVYKDIKNDRMNQSELRLLTLIGGHAILSNKGNLEIFDLQSNETLFSEPFSPVASISDEICVTKTDTIVSVYRYMENEYVQTLEKAISDPQMSPKIIGTKVLLLTSGRVSGGFDYQTGIDLTEEEVTSADLAYQSQSGGDPVVVTADGEVFQYHIDTYGHIEDEVFATLQETNYLTITRKRDLEIRKIDSLYLQEKNQIAEKIMRLWDSRFINPVSIRETNGKMIVQCQTEELRFFMSGSNSPDYFFEYDFASETLHYLGFHSEYFDAVQFIIKK